MPNKKQIVKADFSFDKPSFLFLLFFNSQFLQIPLFSPYYNFAMMVDMEEMMRQPETYVRLVPNFFFRHSDFFRHFTIAIQFTCAEGVVYPKFHPAHPRSPKRPHKRRENRGI